MTRLSLLRRLLGIAAVSSLLASCALRQGMTPMDAAQGGAASTSSSYQLIHGFGAPGRRKHNAGGIAPLGSLIDVKGTLYGTTDSGGHQCHDSSRLYGPGCGTVFSISPSGTWKRLYDFRGGLDGAHPAAGLIDVGGTLYGTTVNGGGYGCSNRTGCGTVFAISTSGVEWVVHSFSGGSDGASPQSSLVDVKGTLYGTTDAGGGECKYTDGCGTVYSITPSGEEHVLHRFADAKSDGAFPVAALVDVNGTLYGTTKGGNAPIYGTIFSITTAGVEKTLYAFPGRAHGEFPASTLVSLGGELYGTTTSGGNPCCGGTVFSVTTTGALKTLHTFPAYGSTGWQPEAGLTAVRGALYGTTEYGGGGGCTEGARSYGCGTIFSITPSGETTDLYDFTGMPGSAYARSTLLDVGGVLYGTSSAGGNKGCKSIYDGSNGCGTVYAFTPMRFAMRLP